MSRMRSYVQPGWECRAFRSPIDGLFGAVVEAEDDVLGVAWDTDLDAAATRALGEAIERSALHDRPSEDTALTVATASDLGASAADLTDCVRFDERQLLSVPKLSGWAWNENTVTTWESLQDANGAPVLVPIDLVRMLGVDATRVRAASSVGTACGPTWRFAKEGALLEAAERHVVAEHVYRQEPAIAISPGEIDEDELVRNLATHGLRLRVGLLPNVFGLPVAIAVIEGDGRATPAAAFGSSANVSVPSALRSAVYEVVHTFHLAWRLLRRGDDAVANPAGINQRAVWWAINGADLVPLYLSDVPKSIEDVSAQLGLDQRLGVSRAIGDALIDAGCQWYVADISPRWAPDMTVVRAVAPALLQLRLDENNPYLRAPRWPETVTALVSRRQRGPEYSHPHPYL